MKNELKILFLFGFFTSCISQTKFTSESHQNQTSRFRIDIKRGTFAEIEIKINENWQFFKIIDEPIGNFEYECHEKNMNGAGSNELILKWSNSVYGSGGGTVTKGLQIWNLDDGSILLDEIIYCSDESFGNDGNAYIKINEKKIVIKNTMIKVYKENLINSNAKSLDFCTLSAIEPGTYILKNRRLQRK